MESTKRSRSASAESFWQQLRSVHVAGKMLQNLWQSRRPQRQRQASRLQWSLATGVLASIGLCPIVPEILAVSILRSAQSVPSRRVQKLLCYVNVLFYDQAQIVTVRKILNLQPSSAYSQHHIFPIQSFDLGTMESFESLGFITLI